MKNPGLEELREVLKDDATHIAIGRITSVSTAQDRSVVRVRVVIVPDETEIVARMTWEHIGPDAGFFQYPSIDDLVLVAFAEGLEDQAYVIKRLTSTIDKVPLRATENNTVIRAIAGKKVFVTSDTEVNINRGDEPATERVVLGDVFKQAYSQHLQTDSVHTHVGNMGFPTAPPQQTADYVNLKASPVDSDEMLSDLVKVDK